MGVVTTEAHSWKGRSVLVTGAAGFLGRETCAQLVARGAQVFGLDIAWDRLPKVLIPVGTSVLDGDVRDSARLRSVMAAASVDSVIHLAAQTLVEPALADPTHTFSQNVEGTWRLLEACRERPAVTAIVVASSDKAYGDYAGRAYREDMAVRGSHPYDVSKAAGDLIAQAYAATYALPVTLTRCGNLFGGGDLNWSRLVPGTIRSVLEGDAPVIRSDGTFVRDYLHVQDAAMGTIGLATAVRDRPDLHGQAFNFATGARPTVIDVVHRILALMDSNLEPVVLAKELQEIPEQRVSAARARRVLGWRPELSLDAGLRQAIDWYRRYVPLIK